MAAGGTGSDLTPDLARAASSLEASHHFRLLNSASGPRAGLPGRFGAAIGNKIGAADRQIARAEGPDSLGPVLCPFELGLRPKPAQNRPRKPGQGTGRIIKHPKVGSRMSVEVDSLEPQSRSGWVRETDFDLMWQALVHGRGRAIEFSLLRNLNPQRKGSHTGVCEIIVARDPMNL